jgi:hypothetical protein
VRTTNTQGQQLAFKPLLLLTQNWTFREHSRNIRASFATPPWLRSRFTPVRTTRPLAYKPLKLLTKKIGHSGDIGGTLREHSERTYWWWSSDELAVLLISGSYPCNKSKASRVTSYSSGLHAFREQAGNIQGMLKEHSGNIHGTLWEHLGNTQGTFREHSGNILGMFRAHSGNIRGTIRFKRFQGSAVCTTLQAVPVAHLGCSHLCGYSTYACLLRTVAVGT